MRLGGGRAIAEHDDGVIYLAIGIRNVGTGLAVLHGWHANSGVLSANDPHAELESFTRQQIDIYVAAGGSSAWESALRDTEAPVHADVRGLVERREQFTIDLLYGDQDGGQRTVTRFLVMPAGDDGWYTQVVRHWSIDRDDPR